MSNLIKNTQKRLYRRERGQVLVVVALSIVVIIAIMGLALDVGVMFIANARLRRAVDSAALAAALQIREGYTMNDLDRSATEFLSLNGIHDPQALVQICNGPGNHNDPSLCTDPPRKLVHVIATGTAQLAFLPVIGIDNVPVAAEAVSEAASVDVVLVIDRSESMTYDAPVNPNNKRDPSVCNYDGTSADGYVGDCHPFDEVKRAAVAFVDQLYFPYDRVALVTFDQTAVLIQDFSNDPSVIEDAIKGLTVFQGATSAADPPGKPGFAAIYSHSDPSPLPSRWYDASGMYYGLDCAQYEATHADPDLLTYYPAPLAGDPSPCTTTDIGDGMSTAGSEFANARQGALWVTILLTDGVANAGYVVNPDHSITYYCPDSTWGNSNVPPKCNDGKTKSISANRHTPATAPEYDAEDYAYDMTDFVAHAQSSLIFTIGLGSQVTTPSTVDTTKLGELFLKYAADQGSGLYSFAPNGAALRDIFLAIANEITTRLAK